jgi:hypothetical protein
MSLNWGYGAGACEVIHITSEMGVLFGSMNGPRLTWYFPKEMPVTWCVANQSEWHHADGRLDV